MSECKLRNVSEKMKKILEYIAIPDADGIRGNISLITSYEDVSIHWESSNTEVITDKAIGGKAAGVVTRQDKDVEVTLSARVSFDKETAVAEYTVKVLKAPDIISEDKYQGYLFGHFIGEGSSDGEQIYFALSEDGLNFKDMNGHKPVLISNVGEKGVRDPYIYRSYEGDRFFLVATDLSIYNRGGWLKNEQGYYDASTTGSPYLVLWQSTDLVNWGEPRLIKAAPENAGMAWAPEMIYNEETGEYIIFFASSIMDPETRYKSKPNAIYYVATRDFVHYSESRLFIDNQTDNEENDNRREIIDTTVIRIGDVYYSASKDGDNAEANGGIRIMKNSNLLDPCGWKKVLDLDELGLDLTGLKIDVLDNTSLEGPELFMYNRRDWADENVPEYGLIADQYNLEAGYLPLKTTDFEDITNSNNSWKVLSDTEYSFDELKKRHGTILRITDDELKRLKEAFDI